MNKKIAIGIDIGGSHITSAAVDIEALQIVPNTLFSVKVNNKATKDDILKNWSESINKTIQSIPLM
ncbi:MAG: hypothetical protein O3C47_05955 [Bacteroidetes bacterium]|nr:hypothetical protein [Bacteroidota bacterium]